MIYDITPTISPDLAVFPGDQVFQRHKSRDVTAGDNYTLSSIVTTLHLGAHADAPNHYHPDGCGIETRPLDFYLGPCQVIDVSASVTDEKRISRSSLSTDIIAPRVLFKTNTYPDPNHWQANFSGLSAEVVDYLATQQVRLIGIDTPSVDPAEDADLQSHQAIYRHDMAVLEGIVLDKVPEGRYILLALPLPIQAADASPVRAVLLTMQTWQAIADSQ